MEKQKYSTLGRYILVRTLGSGVSSKVKLGIDKETQKQYAVKILKAGYNKFTENEISTLKKLSHPHIVNMMEFMENVDHIKKSGEVRKVTAIVIEIAGGGEIFEFLFRTGRFSEEVSRFYFRNIIDALEYIHAQGYAHRDMKPENIMITNDFVLKIADFGFSVMLGKNYNGLLDSYLGTRGYMAPEIILRSPYSGQSVDLFAAGIILFIFLTGIPPFSEANPNDPYYKLLYSNKHEFFWHSHAKSRPMVEFTPDFRDLMNKMFAYEPANRLTLADIKAHPWYNGPVPDFEYVQGEMQRRFSKVQAEMEKERILKKEQAAKKKMIIEHAKKPSPTAFLMGYPKGKGSQDNLEVADIAEIEARYPTLKRQDREVLEYTEDPKKGGLDYLCSDNVYNSVIALMYVIQNLESLKAKNVKLSENSYKVTLDLVTEESEKINFVARFFKNDDSTTYIRFEKLPEAPLAKYHELIEKIEKELEIVTRPAGEPKPQAVEAQPTNVEATH